MGERQESQDYDPGPVVGSELTIQVSVLGRQALSLIKPKKIYQLCIAVLIFDLAVLVLYMQYVMARKPTCFLTFLSQEYLVLNRK